MERHIGLQDSKCNFSFQRRDDQASTAALNCILRSGHSVDEKAEMLKQLWAMFQSLTGIANDQLAISLQELPSSNAMEMGMIMQGVGHQ